MTAAAILPSVTGGVLVASPSSQVRNQMLSRLDPGHRPAYEASGGAEALAKLDGGNWQMLILDRQLPDLDAEELAQITERLYPGIQVLLVDSRADADPEQDLANRGQKSEWFHAATRLSTNRREIIQRHSEKNQVEKNNDAPLPEMIGDTEPMRHVYRMVRLVAHRNTTVLITGPTGSGKELVARAIHQLSGRAGNSFSVLNCAAIPEGLIESELFGYVRGAFTGAAQTYGGRILAAQGGTLFLDEIGELPLNAQSKLLRFLEQKEVQRLGSAETTRVDVRVVAATNSDLAAAVERGSFRADLFFRLCAFPIGLTPLAERVADILKLTVFFLRRLAGRGPALRLDAKAQQMLDTHFWPGNVRELQQVLERAAILVGDGHTILPEHLVFSFPQKSAGGEESELEIMLATQIPDGQILDDQDILKTLSLDALNQQGLAEAFDVFSSAARSLERSYFSLGEEVCRLRKELEAERELRKRREALAEISALLAHEVRNPLGSVELFAELLAESGLPQQEREWVEQIRGGVRLLSATVNNVLEFHSQTPLKLAPTETSAVVGALGKLLAPMAQAAGMQLHIESCTQELRIQADRHRLEQVFLNLALNAFRFAATGGVLRIRVLRQDSWALVEFEDRGPGLAAEDKAKVFAAGFSTRTGGAGLGLTVAKRIVEQHAGNLDIINGMNGCTFQVRIPLATASS